MMKHLYGLHVATGLLTTACLLIAGCTQQINATAAVGEEGNMQSGQSRPEHVAGAGMKSGCSSPLLRPQFSRLDKIDRKLLCVEALAAGRGASFAAVAANAGIRTVGGGVVLDIVMNRMDDAASRRLRMPGLTILFQSGRYRRISAVINHSALLYQLASLPEVRLIKPEHGAGIRSSGGSTRDVK
jgi:hypothetical protein